MDDLRLLARLNDETQPLHAEADGDVDRYLFRQSVTTADYRTYLSRVYGFLVPLEASLALAPGLDEVLDVKARAKSALVVHDLLSLGLSMTEVNALPQCTSVPTFRGPASALGWLYVVERPMLSAAVIRGHLSTYLRAEMACASAYLACYSGQVGAMWRELGQAMERVAYTTAIADRIVAGARQAFISLAHWRIGEVDELAGIRIAG